MKERKTLNVTEQATAHSGMKSLFSHNWVVRNIPFFLFLSSMAVVNIYFGHYSEKLSRKIGVVEKRMKEMEYEYKTIKSDVIFRSKWSKLVSAVEPLGLRELKEPPIYLDDSFSLNIHKETWK